MINENLYKLNSKEHDKVLHDIREKIFENKSPVDYPKIIILGGQPGAGKSKIITLSENEFFKDGNVVKINGDDFRKYHPKAEEIFKNYNKLFAKLTDPDVREWTLKIFEESMDKKFNIKLSNSSFCNFPVPPNRIFLTDYIIQFVRIGNG
ncbi:zeta toxin [Caldicellulosiruptor bescii]|uniref:UDP-N-acetylglucosamine kinase n=2 Tax=Caldicellulosiruptor bescii TaxID=31899 RepID=B9MQR5_CALBD|nr:zeta toxin family protein [Caldicellulosiruptor bescii]ACM60019.1 Zeta toxin family protein [Caldicellulosiruptor bescii DSM 6725]PBC87439.1 zeta toxin [Caldicellulosiruptor bescii]PBC90372.1 zeta toxin [Caldicellulosiruptor bescii]PBD04196.1 zeta toxin [Caldicellulosiruptor bescii]PBD06169.1 zeta toxin [Caldicellulosiruptor bescii]